MSHPHRPASPAAVPPSAPRLAAARLLAAAALAAAALAGACAEGDRSGVRDARAAEREPPPAPAPTDVTLPGLAPASDGYRVAPVANGGQVTGTVSLAGDAPPDTVVAPDPALSRACGARLVVRALEHRGALVGGALVWLVGVREGKASTAPLRQTLTLDRCQLSPRVAAMPLGATLNVKGRDPLSLRLRAVEWPGGRTRATWRMTDAGQVVPDARVLAEAGAIEVRGESLPWVRAWLLVFDHPYHATTDAAGTFALDSVPPGDYRLVAWHPRAGRVEQPVTVGAGQTATVGLTLVR